MKKNLSFGVRVTLVGVLATGIGACVSANSSGSGGSAGSGGATGSGGGGREDAGGSGGSASGGAAQSGGSHGSGGMASDGNGSGGGGAPTGGVSGSGGAGSGGITGSGGSATGSGGRVGSGGATGSGGAGMGGSATGGGGAGTVDAATMALAMGFGTNLGNSFDNTTTWETGWGQPLVTQTFINGLASHHIKTVRVPVAWNTYAVNGAVDSTKLNRVKEVVGWIQAAGMYAIVNIHWDGGWIDNQGNANQYRLTEDVKTKFGAYWIQIATGFSDVDEHLILEGLNEESQFFVGGQASGAPDYAALNTLNQLFVTTVRAQAGHNKTRALLIAGFTTDIMKTCVDAFDVPSDPAGTGKLFLSLHYYTPYTFCGLDTVESWGSPQTTWGSATDKSALQDLFDLAGAFSKARKIPLIIGEFGVTLGQSYPRDPASRALWMESVAKAALSYGMVPVLWDTGSDISRTDGSFSTALQAVFKNLKL